MKIVQLDAQLSWRGGEQQVLYLSQALHAHGYDHVTVCQPHSALYQRVCEARLPVHALRVRHEADVVAAWQLARYLRRERVDILHMHESRGHTIGLLACLFNPQLRRVVSRRVAFKPMRNRFSHWKYQMPCVQYLAISDAVRQVMIESGVPGAQVWTIYSGIDLKRCDNAPETEPLFPPGTRVVGTVGHLVSSKGHRYLLEAAQHLIRDEPKLGVAIVGGGVLRRSLEADAVALGLAEHVKFTGFRRDILSLMKDFELFVSPSELEGLGTSILDAMALRKPVVATHAGGIPETVQDGVTGLLVPPRDAAALAQAIRHLLQHPELQVRFGEAGRHRVEQGFTAERMARQTMQVYHQLMRD
jgi:glycosyltransferase involved in cell wall biosynthesis